MLSPNFGTTKNAQELLRERTQLKDTLEKLNAVATHLDDADVMLEMAAEDEDALSEANSATAQAQKALAAMEFTRMLGGQHDKSSCFVSVNPGAGGTESQDWPACCSGCYSVTLNAKGGESN